MTVIAMTREIGSLGTEVAAGLADELGLRIINSEMVASNVAGSMRMEESAVQRYLDGSASMFERWRIDKRKLSLYTHEEILRLAQQGNVLIRGWGASALFQNVPQVISVRVCAPKAFRERVMVERLGTKDVEAVRREIERYDAACTDSIRASFDIDREDSLLYHIVLNTSRIPIDICVKAVCQLARDPRFQDEPAARSAFADKLLQAKIDAVFMEQFGTGSVAVTVSVENGRAVLDGVTSDGSVQGRAEQLARGIEGISEVDNRIKSIPRYGREFSYPTRAVRLIGGFAAGGAFDITARLIGQVLSDRLSQPFVIENRSPAGSKFPAEAVVRASADGHTLALVGAADAIRAARSDTLSLVRDLAPVAGIVRVPSVMVVPSSFAAKTIPELIAYAKANPARLKLASVGNGTVSHALGELFQMMADVTVTHVPHRGGAPAIAALLAGQAQVMFVVLPAAIEHINAGNLRPLAVTAASPVQALPDVPTLGEFLPGYEASGWQGIVAPKETSAQIVSRLNKEINAGLDAPEIKARLTNLGGTILAGSPADFSKLIADETEKWAKVVKFAGREPPTAPGTLSVEGPQVGRDTVG